LTINKINFRSTLAALVFGALVTVLPASADTVSFGTSSSLPFSVGSYTFAFNGATISNLTVGTGGVALNGTSTINSFGGFTVSAGSGAASQVVDVDVTPTNINGTPVTTANPLQFDGSIVDTAGVYKLVFSAGNGATAGTGAYAGDIVQTQGNLIYAVAASTTLNLTGNKSFFINGIVAAIAPEPATFATTGLAAAFLSMFLRRRMKQTS
jgi:hypothetical protein